VLSNGQTVTTVLGDITITARAYYFCSACNRGFYPKNYTLRLAESSLSPGVARMVGLVAVEGSFMEGTMLHHKLAALDVSDKVVERTTKMIGEAMIKDEATVVTATQNSGTNITCFKSRATRQKVCCCVGGPNDKRGIRIIAVWHLRFF